MTDPIADMLTRMRNAIKAKHQKVDLPVSLLKLEIARVLKEEGYINNFKIIGDSVTNRMIRVYLRYGLKGESIVSRLERVSRPGCRQYVGKAEIPNVLGGLGVNIISTSHGVMTGKQARRANVGGELLCQIY